MTVFYLYSFLLGLVLGSFYNVVGLRVPKNESIVKPPSHCPKCGRLLTFIELIPVLSYIFLRGRCRNCGQKISFLYPTIELITGVLFVCMAFRYGLSSNLLIGWLLTSLLIIILVSDLKYMIIPDKVLVVFSMIFIALRLWQPLHPWWSSLLGCIIGFLLLYIIALVSCGGMGGGDIKLFAVLGILLGWKFVIVSFILSIAFGAIIGVLCLTTHCIEPSKPVPFGPYIVLGTLTTYLYGDGIIHWYINLIN